MDTKPSKGQTMRALAELFLGGQRVVGEVRSVAGPRHLVDILNAIDDAFIPVYDGELDDPFQKGEKPRHFDVTHIHRNAILFALPRAWPPIQTSPIERVPKEPVRATIVLPGFEIVGNVHVVPGIHPAEPPMHDDTSFIPVTDAVVVVVRNGGFTWREPILVVNLARAQTYATKGRQASEGGVVLRDGPSSGGQDSVMTLACHFCSGMADSDDPCWCLDCQLCECGGMMNH